MAPRPRPMYQAREMAKYPRSRIAAERGERYATIDGRKILDVTKCILPWGVGQGQQPGRLIQGHEDAHEEICVELLALRMLPGGPSAYSVDERGEPGEFFDLLVDGRSRHAVIFQLDRPLGDDIEQSFPDMFLDAIDGGFSYRNRQTQGSGREPGIGKDTCKSRECVDPNFLSVN